MSLLRDTCGPLPAAAVARSGLFPGDVAFERQPAVIAAPRSAMIQHIQSWYRTSLSARIQAHPAGTPDEQLPEGLVLDKKHTPGRDLLALMTAL